MIGHTGGIASWASMLATGVFTGFGLTVLVLNAKPRRPSSCPVINAGEIALAHSIAC